MFICVRARCNLFISPLITESETRRLGPSVSNLCKDSLKNYLDSVKGMCGSVRITPVVFIVIQPIRGCEALSDRNTSMT